jgi:hypothetical protein
LLILPYVDRSRMTALVLQVDAQGWEALPLQAHAHG